MRAPNQFHLLTTRRFLPLFITQAIGAFNDNALRNAIAILITYRLAQEQGLNASTFVQIGLAAFILPYLLFSALAGQLADKFDKAVIARRIKLADLLAMLFGAYALWANSPMLDLLVLFFAGSVAAFFGPIKYGVLPQYLHEDELVAGNGLIEMGTFVTILLGTIFGGGLILTDNGTLMISVTLVGLAALAYYAAWQMPAAPSVAEHHQINWHLLHETRKLMGYAAERRDVFWSVLGASWFWFLGAIILSQLPVFTEQELHGNQNVVLLLTATFTIGIAAGSLLTNSLLKGQVSARYVPGAAIMMTLCLIDLYFTGNAVHQLYQGDDLHNVGQFFSTWPSLHLLLDLFFLAFFGGIYAVPLNAIMQGRSAPEKRSRVIAANNIFNALFMIVGSIISMALLRFMSSSGLYLLLGIANALVALWSIRLLPQDITAALVRGLLRLLYRVEVKGLEHYYAAGSKTVVIANHTSLLDGPLLSVFLPERATFAINSLMARKWWVKPAFALLNMAPIDPGSPLALRTLVDAIKQGDKVVIFPEGRITTTGTIMKIYDGPAAVAQMADATILPVRIDGAQYSKLSYLKGKVRQRWFPKITITFLAPTRMATPEGMRGAALRQAQANQLYDIMTNMMFVTSDKNQTLWQSLLEARKINGGGYVIVEDIQRKPMTYNRLIMGALVLGRNIARATPAQAHVGLLLPNATATVVSLFGLLASGRVAAMLNFSTGPTNMQAACRAAQVTSIVTSRKFIEAGEMQADLDMLARDCKIIYLEDIAASIGMMDKLYGLYAKYFTAHALKTAGATTNADSAAVVLFTSGSEGVPKGVVLSHHNLNANRLQVAARISFNNEDVAFNALPMFHALGLLGGTLLPILSGVYCFLYPSPLHLKIVPELCYDTSATVLFGTDTFLMGYARNANPYDFYRMRLVIAGAEKVKQETRDVWSEKFGLRILEGYGATECSPVLSLNTPMYNRNGTTGRVLDQLETRLDPVPGIDKGGRLFVKGPNVMLGYLRHDNPGVLEPPADGWYDTGDIVDIDEQKFLTILGRAKRFAKIGGEMVSLGGIETKLAQAFPDFGFAVVAIADPKKGEQLVLFTTQDKPVRKTIADALKAQGATELMIPKTLKSLKTIPLLGSGKTDYVTLQKLASDVEAGDKTGEGETA